MRNILKIFFIYLIIFTASQKGAFIQNCEHYSKSLKKIRVYISLFILMYFSFLFFFYVSQSSTSNSLETNPSTDYHLLCDF